MFSQESCVAYMFTHSLMVNEHFLMHRKEGYIQVIHRPSKLDTVRFHANLDLALRQVTFGKFNHMT